MSLRELDRLRHKQHPGREGEDGKIVSGGLFEAGFDSTELLEPGEATLDEMTLGVEVLVQRMFLGSGRVV